MNYFTQAEHRMLNARDGVDLNLSIWRAEHPKANLFYIHGIQSHSGWLFETGPELAKQGINVFALDRRGSGRSGGPRGHAESSHLILEDYRLALDYALAVAPGLPCHILGQSFGGSILAALLCRYDLPVQSVIFSAPSLGQQRHRHAPQKLNQLRATRSSQVSAIGLRDSDYSLDDRYLRFMANDALMNRMISDSMRSVLVELEDIYVANELCLGRLNMPIHFIEPERDDIIDLKVSRAVLEPFVPLIDHKIPQRSHYTEFSDQRHQLWKLMTSLCVTQKQEQEQEQEQRYA